MKLTTTVTKLVEAEFDTDDFTPAQWRQFIMDNVSSHEIARTIKNDLFPLDRLKARAIQIHQLRQEFDIWG